LEIYKMASPEVIDVDADEHPRVAGGTGKPDAPFEIASSDSEDEKPAKRAKPAPVTPPSPGRRGRAEDGAHRPTGRAGIPEEEGSRAVLVRVSKVKSIRIFGEAGNHQLASVLQPLARLFCASTREGARSPCNAQAP
jgi:hypothetical protein